MSILYLLTMFLSIVFQSNRLYKCKETTQYQFYRVNPLGPKSVQHQFSPNNISRSSRVKVMRITKLITKGRNTLILHQILWTILKRNVWRSVWRICIWILGLKGLRRIKKGKVLTSGWRKYSQKYLCLSFLTIHKRPTLFFHSIAVESSSHSTFGMPLFSRSFAYKLKVT